MFRYAQYPIPNTYYPITTQYLKIVAEYAIGNTPAWNPRGVQRTVHAGVRERY
jgi:hypothetical protein